MNWTTASAAAACRCRTVRCAIRTTRWPPKGRGRAFLSVRDRRAPPCSGALGGRPLSRRRRARPPTGTARPGPQPWAKAVDPSGRRMARRDRSRIRLEEAACPRSGSFPILCPRAGLQIAKHGREHGAAKNADGGDERDARRRVCRGDNPSLRPPAAASRRSGSGLWPRWPSSKARSVRQQARSSSGPRRREGERQEIPVPVHAAVRASPRHDGPTAPTTLATEAMAPIDTRFVTPRFLMRVGNQKPQA